MTEGLLSDEKLREALMRDFRKLYVKEFTTDWEAQRLVREVELSVMSLENLKAQLAKVQEHYKAAEEHTSHLVDDVIRLELELKESKQAWLDRPELREKLAQYQMALYCKNQGWEVDDWSDLPREVQQRYYREADQILSLFDKEEK